MNKLISVGFMRLWRDKPFWIACAFMILYGAVISLRTDTNAPLEAIFFAFAVVIGIPSAAFCSLFMGTEYSDGTLRNKIIVGHTRATVYFSSLIVNFAACLLIALSYVLAVLVAGCPRLGFFQFGMKHMVLYSFAAVMMIFAFASIYTIIGMLLTNKATSAVVCILLFLALFAPSITIQSRLSEPEYYKSSVDVSHTADMQSKKPNPNYLAGMKREMYRFLYNLILPCQGMQITIQSSKEIVQLPLFSTGTIIISSGLGVFLFRKKDLK